MDDLKIYLMVETVEDGRKELIEHVERMARRQVLQYKLRAKDCGNEIRTGILPTL